MEKYVALLRGINVGGKNRIPMPELRAIFEDIGFLEVMTYINSGNVIFKTDIEDRAKLIQLCEEAIENKFMFKVFVAIVSLSELMDLIKYAPEWWGMDDKIIYHNTIFVIEPACVEEIFEVMGEEYSEHEKIDYHGRVIYWSAHLKNFSKTKWSKLASSSVNSKVTVRNANTVKKLVSLMNQS